MAVLSVIIPMYNVEDYLHECLTSVATAIEDVDAEVLLIDDGSTDETSTIAKIFSSDSEKFIYYAIERSGVSEARNYGISLSSGKYLAFVDGDDLVSKTIFSHMLYIAERNDADMVVCNATHIEDNGRGVNSAQFQIAFSGTPFFSSSIRENINYVYDTAIWNKLVRRDLWFNNGISFPENHIYEDMPVSFKLYLCARKIYFIYSYEYFHRIRSKGEKSITQELTEENNLNEKICMNLKILKILEKYIGENKGLIKIALEKRFLCWDFEPYLTALSSMDCVKKKKFISAVSKFLKENISPAAFEGLQLYHKAKCQYIIQGDIDQLQRIINHKKYAWVNAPIKKKNDKFIVELPQNIYKNHFADAKTELQHHIPLTKLLDFSKKDNLFYFEVMIFYPRINVKSKNSQKCSVYVYNDYTGKKIPCISEKIKIETPDTYNHIVCMDDFRTYDYDYTWSGVRFEIDITKIAENDLQEKRDIKSDNCFKWIVFFDYDTEIAQSSRVLRGVPSEYRDVLGGQVYHFEKGGKSIYIDVKYDIRNTLYFETMLEDSP